MRSVALIYHNLHLDLHNNFLMTLAGDSQIPQQCAQVNQQLPWTNNLAVKATLWRLSTARDRSQRDPNGLQT
jgi:hypothetical protein